MNYGKLDAALAAALSATGDAEDETEAPDLTVFVHLADDVPASDREVLADLGLAGAGGSEGAIRTATLTSAQVAKLSDQPSVRRLELSARLRLRPDRTW